MNVGVVLVAAGQGIRLGVGRPKALVEIGGEPLVAHAVRGICACAYVDEVVVVAPRDHLRVTEAAVAGVCRQSSVHVTVVAGGDDRSASVIHGTRALSSHVGIILVHDAARAFTPVAVFERVIAAVCAGHAAVIPVVPVADTIKILHDYGDDPAATSPTVPGEYIAHTVDRDRLRAVQTPQGFLRETLQRAQSQISPDISCSTDDAGLVEAMGERVFAVPGAARAHKITTGDDLELAQLWSGRQT